MEKDLTKSEKRIEILKSKFFLTDVCFEKVIDSMLSTADKRIVQFFNDLRGQICTSYVQMT